MTLTKEQLAELEEASRPIWEFMEKYCHPHCKIIVEQTGVELVEGVGSGINPDYRNF